MIFQSTVVKAQWDNWCFQNNGIHYLYYLITEYSGGEGIGVATSTDGVHWDDHGWAIRASSEMVEYLGTGAVWKAVDFEWTGRFLCNYSEWRVESETGRKTQNILFAASTDLIHWEKLGDASMFRVDERWYDRYGRWDCIFPLSRDEGGYWGAWTATAKPGSNRQGTVGIGFSDDGLRWTALKAPEVSPGVDEAGAIERFEGRIHAMFGAGGAMWAYTADRVTGPYRRSERNALLLHPGHTYFSRFYPVPDGTTLVNHQSNSEWGWHIAPLKQAVVDGEGVLRLTWWRGNEALKGELIGGNECHGTDDEAMSNEPLDFDPGVVIEATARLPDPDAGMQAALLLHLDDGRKWVVRIDSLGRMEIDGIGSHRSDDPPLSIDRERTFPPHSRFRLLARRGMLEAYLDDELMTCFKLEGALGSKTFRITCAGDRAEAVITGIRTWRMSLHPISLRS